MQTLPVKYVIITSIVTGRERTGGFLHIHNVTYGGHASLGGTRQRPSKKLSQKFDIRYIRICSVFVYSTSTLVPFEDGGACLVSTDVRLPFHQAMYMYIPLPSIVTLRKSQASSYQMPRTSRMHAHAGPNLLAITPPFFFSMDAQRSTPLNQKIYLLRCGHTRRLDSIQLPPPPGA